MEIFAGAPMRLTAEQLAARERLNARMKLESVHCLCGAAGFETLAEVDRFGLHQPTVICHRCGLIQSNPRMSAADYRAFYASDEYRALYDGGDFDYSVRYTAATGRTIQSALAPYSPRRVLEIGAGGGWNLVAFREAGIQVAGYDYSEKLVAFGQGREIDMRAGSLDEALAAGEKWDAVILNHVLEHFLDPVAELRKIHGLLSEHGVLFVGVPATDYPWVQLLQNAHVYYFTQATLTHYLALAGWVCGRIERENTARMHTIARRGESQVLLLGEHEAAIRRLRRRRALLPFLGVMDRAMSVLARLR